MVQELQAEEKTKSLKCKGFLIFIKFYFIVQKHK